MLRAIVAVLICSALAMFDGSVSAAPLSDATTVPDFVQVKLTEFTECAREQKLRDTSKAPPSDMRLELCGAEFEAHRGDLAFVRKCLARNKIIKVEHMTSFRVKGGEGFFLTYHCTTPYLDLGVIVGVIGQTAQVVSVETLIQ